MEIRDYSAILSRVSRRSADDLDDLIAEFETQPDYPGTEVFPDVDAVLMPEIAFKREDAVCIGFVIEGALADPADRATRLAAMALERDVEIVLLTSGKASGLEPFGFRSEVIAGDTTIARAACLDQARRFWKLDLLL